MNPTDQLKKVTKVMETFPSYMNIGFLFYSLGNGIPNKAVTAWHLNCNLRAEVHQTAIELHKPCNI